MTSQKTMQTLMLVFACLMLPVHALAATYQSVGDPKAILYDGPSSLATKRFIVRHLYPLEVIVKPANGWAKVRDPDGGLYFIQADKLSDERTVLVNVDNVQLHESPSANTKVIARVEKQVVLMLNSTQLVNGWLSVRTTEGKTGFVPLATVWGY